MSEIKHNLQFMLTSEEKGTKLEVVKQLKTIFKEPGYTFSKIKLKTVLDCVKIMLDSNVSQQNLLYNYGSSLVQAVGMGHKMDVELFDHLECILLEMNKLNIRLTDDLVTYLLKEKHSIQLPAGILLASKQTIEKMIVHCITATNYQYLDILSQISATSPKLFQTVTSILYKILVETDGHEKVFEVSELFVESVKFKSQTEGKNFLGLYPRGCCQLVSSLMISPEIYTQYNRDISNVFPIIMETYLKNRTKALILLSHFPNWIHPFVTFLKEC